MSIFSRFKDIINSNMNALLDRAEDPEKLLKLMIREMEDTLVEMKASCAGAMASRTRVERSLGEAQTHAASWGAKAELAVEKGREDLAREALVEKRAFNEKAITLQKELDQHEALVVQYRGDIQLLNDKLEQARKKHRILVQRHIRANRSRTAREQAEKTRGAEAMIRFDKFEQRVDRMEAEAELAGSSGSPVLEDEFAKLELDDEIEKELSDLKKSKSGSKKS
ncbi:phage shock protein PspA [Rubellicoccus peritrichatus]|uniref:Phage shock protein PspA n=1 Tax=Rubellicoccus peritrichatus TaxID=3080537 RepID=A0AAQ3LE76_9BACT|nr:phage shock protein PspA [Puniceicoccus sp. CR14]WOO42879.1 phage shock protein PspA [Puniceicoccus sp. CR14]